MFNLLPGTVFEIDNDQWDQVGKEYTVVSAEINTNSFSYHILVEDARMENGYRSITVPTVQLRVLRTLS